MDIFKNLPFISKGADEDIDPAEAKQARVQFHREQVRVGPLGRGAWRRQDNFALATKPVSKGKARRAAARDAKKQVAANFERSKQQHFANRAEAATLRGQLQAVGLIPYVFPESQLDAVAARRSTIYLIHRFADAEGTVEVTETLVRDSLQSALNRWESLVQRPLTKIPDDYVLPVQVAAVPA